MLKFVNKHSEQIHWAVINETGYSWKFYKSFEQDIQSGCFENGNAVCQLIIATTMLSVSALNRLSFVARHLERAYLLRSVERRLDSNIRPSFSSFSSLPQSINMYRIEERGTPNSLDYRLFIRKFHTSICTFYICHSVSFSSWMFNVAIQLIFKMNSVKFLSIGVL